jgi:hypothetical protein
MYKKEKKININIYNSAIEEKEKTYCIRVTYCTCSKSNLMVFFNIEKNGSDLMKKRSGLMGSMMSA